MIPTNKLRQLYAEEIAGAKEYNRLGYTQFAKDELRHAQFHKFLLKQRGK